MRLADYLGHMLEATQLIRGYTRGLTKASFLEDKKTQQAVILNILITGEAATKIYNGYPAFVADHPEVPWKQMWGDAQSHGAWLFRDQSGYCLGYRSRVLAKA